MAAIAPDRPATRRSPSGTGRRQYDAHLRLVIDTIPAMVWSLEPNGALDFVNQRWLEYTGLALAEALARPTSIVHPDDLPKVIQTWLANQASRTAYEDEMRLRRADGAFRWFLVRTVPLADAKGNIVKWYGTATDIEDRKRADEALRQREIELAEAQRVARVGSWSIEVATDTVRGSDEYFRIFELDRALFDGRSETIWSMVHPKDYARVAQAAAEAVSGGKPYRLEYRIRTRSGQQKHIRSIGYARMDSAGTVAVRFGTVQDITEHKHDENALREAASQLQALSRRLVEVQESERKELSRELHDRVGQSLTALNINLAILREGLSRHGIGIRTRLDDCSSLVETSMQSIGNVLSELRPQVLDDLGLRAALKWHASQFSARTAIAVSVSASEPYEPIAADRKIVLFRIAQEALNNVAKHAGAASVEIEIECRETEYKMSVTDDGVGLAELDAGSDRPRQGLGMVTMRERAQAVGGEIRIESLPGRGTRLTVRIPR